MQPHDEPNLATESSGKHDNNREGLTKVEAEVVGAICLVLVVVGAGAGYYAFNYITKDSERMKFWVGFMFSFAALLVIAVQSVIYVKQAEFMKQQSKAMTDSVDRADTIIERMQDQLDAINQQLGLEKQQVEIAARQVKLWIERERAIIGVRRMAATGLDARPDRDGKGAVSVKITFRNGGHTSAWQFRANANVEVGESPRKFEWAEITSPVRQFFIPETEDRNVDFEPTGLVDILAVYRGDKFLFVDGEARYSTLGGERVLRFGATWNEGKKEFGVRYQDECEAKTEETAAS